MWFQYSADRKVEHPARHLKNFSGVLQADAYSGYDAIYKDGRTLEAGCWSHVRRKLWDIHVKQKRQLGTLAHQGLVRIGELFRIEAEVNGRSALRRRRMRQARTVPVLKELKSWMNETLAHVSAKSPIALAIGYSLGHWTALTNFVSDGRIDAHNNTADFALCCRLGEPPETRPSRTAAVGRHAPTEPATCPPAELSAAYLIAVGRDRLVLADSARSQANIERQDRHAWVTSAVRCRLVA